MEGFEESLATSYQGLRWTLLDNCIIGTEGRVSFRVTICNSTDMGQDARLMPPGDIQQERCNVCLALILAGFLSPPVPRCWWKAVSEALARGSERILRHIYPQSDHGAASEVDDSVDSDHLQVQLDVPRPFDGACHHQGGTHRPCLPHIELSTLVARFDLENVIGTRVSGCCLHLEDVSRNGASWHHIHVPIQDGEWLVSAAGVLSRTHTAVFTNQQIRLLTADGINTFEAPL